MVTALPWRLLKVAVRSSNLATLQNHQGRCLGIRRGWTLGLFTVRHKDKLENKLQHGLISDNYTVRSCRRIGVLGPNITRFRGIYRKGLLSLVLL